MLCKRLHAGGNAKSIIKAGIIKVSRGIIKISREENVNRLNGGIFNRFRWPRK
jgi:hypothetical protein